jgi:hypothetical protein
LYGEADVLLYSLAELGCKEFTLQGDVLVKGVLTWRDVGRWTRGFGWVGDDLLGLKSGRAEYLKDRGVISEHVFVTRRAWEDWGCVLDGHGQESNAS